MKKVLLISLLVSFILLSLISAQPSQQINYTTSSGSIGIVVTQLNYQPYPANPGEYFDLWIQAQYIGSYSAPNATFILEPDYPFSIDPNESAMMNFINLGSTPVLLHYKVKVDQNAVQGDNTLNLEYNPDGGSNFAIKSFDIQVADTETSFESVVQDATSSATSIGIANVGENTANSLIVGIPNQAGFEVIGANQQIVGNLNSGDYTIASFDLVSTARASSNETLEVQLNYTDLIGVRRTVIENIPFNFASSLNSSVCAG